MRSPSSRCTNTGDRAYSHSSNRDRGSSVVGHVIAQFNINVRMPTGMVRLLISNTPYKIGDRTESQPNLREGDRTSSTRLCHSF
ncbi:MAG: hypothetical protein HC866_18880 [Leptolyngbyaceae cyanobacterium RU_5_1]|nr:hypothetical protein [Leptolyngbyaceae cyanobacterium RU_5_1]